MTTFKALRLIGKQAAGVVVVETGRFASPAKTTGRPTTGPRRALRASVRFPMALRVGSTQPLLLREQAVGSSTEHPRQGP